MNSKLNIDEKIRKIVQSPLLWQAFFFQIQNEFKISFKDHVKAFLLEENQVPIKGFDFSRMDNYPKVLERMILEELEIYHLKKREKDLSLDYLSAIIKAFIRSDTNIIEYIRRDVFIFKLTPYELAWFFNRAENILKAMEVILLNSDENWLKKLNLPSYYLSLDNEDLMPNEILKKVGDIYSQEDKVLKEKEVHSIYYDKESKDVWYLFEYDKKTKDAYGLILKEHLSLGFFNLEELKAKEVKRILLENLPKALQEILFKRAFIENFISREG